MKISQLPSTNSVTGTEVLPIVQSGTTKKVTISDALAGAGGGSQNLQQVTDLGSTTTNAISVQSDGNHFINITPFDGSASNLQLYNSGSIGYANAQISSTNDANSDYKDVYLNISLDNLNNNTSNQISIGSFYSGGNDLYSEMTIRNGYGVFGITNEVDNRFTYYEPNGVGGEKGSVLKFDFGSISSNFFTSSRGTLTQAGISLDYTNGQYSIGNISGSLLNINDSLSIIKSSYQGSDKGFYLDFGNGIYSLNGDGINFLNIDLSGPLVSLQSNGEMYFQTTNGVGLYATNNTANFGNIASLGSYLHFDNSANQLYTISSITTSQLGLILDFSNSVFQLGDANGTNISVINSVGNVSCYASNDMNLTSSASGIHAYNNITNIGDVNTDINGTTFGVDDNNVTLLASSNLIVSTSGSAAGKHLKINVGGIDYVIELKNP